MFLWATGYESVEILFNESVATSRPRRIAAECCRKNPRRNEKPQPPRLMLPIAVSFSMMFFAPTFNAPRSRAALARPSSSPAFFKEGC
jgi:hypothetical protein